MLGGPAYSTEFLLLLPMFPDPLFFLRQHTLLTMTVQMMTVATIAMMTRMIEKSLETVLFSSWPPLVTSSCSEVGVVLTGEEVLRLDGGVWGLLLFSVEVNTGCSVELTGIKLSSASRAITSPVRLRGVSQSTRVWLTLDGFCIIQFLSGRISLSHLQGFCCSRTSVAAERASRLFCGRLGKELFRRSICPILLTPWRKPTGRELMKLCSNEMLTKFGRP